MNYTVVLHLIKTRYIYKKQNLKIYFKYYFSLLFIVPLMDDYCVNIILAKKVKCCNIHVIGFIVCIYISLKTTIYNLDITDINNKCIYRYLLMSMSYFILNK